MGLELTACSCLSLWPSLGSAQAAASTGCGAEREVSGRPSLWPLQRVGMILVSQTWAGRRHTTVACLGPAAYLQRQGCTPRSGKGHAGTPPSVWLWRGLLQEVSVVTLFPVPGRGGGI